MTRKGTRLAVIVAIALLVLIAATAFFINLYRDSIALEVARSALRDSDIQVSDVSVESISSNEVRFDVIVLELAAGGTVFIEGITLPIRVRGLRDSALHVDTLTFVPGTMDAGPTRFAAGLQSFLDAPAATPGTTIRIDEVLLPDMPPIRGLAWHADRLNPTLRATVDTFELFVTTTAESDGTFRGTLRALMPDDTETVMLGFQVEPDQSGFRILGNIGLMLEPLLPALHAIGAVPAEVTALAARLEGAFEFRLEADETLPVEIQVHFDTASGTAMSYHADASEIELSLIETTPVNATFEYPSLDWAVEVARSSVSVVGAPVDLPTLRLRNSMCRSGISCRTALDVSYGKLVAGDLTIDAVAAHAGAVQFASRDGRWQASSPDTQFTLTRPTVAGRGVVAPVIEADLSASNERVSAIVNFGTAEEGLSGSAALSHDIATAAGKFTLESAAIDFERLTLSTLFIDWPYDFDIALCLCRIGSGDGRLPRRPLRRYRLRRIQQPAGNRSEVGCGAGAATRRIRRCPGRHRLPCREHQRNGHAPHRRAGSRGEFPGHDDARRDGHRRSIPLRPGRREQRIDAQGEKRSAAVNGRACRLGSRDHQRQRVGRDPCDHPRKQRDHRRRPPGERSSGRRHPVSWRRCGRHRG
jgi:hypothetical protein